MTAADKILVENVNHPGLQSPVDARKYHAMRRVLLKVIPKKKPGLTQAEMLAAIRPHLPQELWPEGNKSGWWMKTVQLDLEAKGLVKRTDSRPLTWYRP